MKYAYVHDRIFFWGGAEQVFADLIQKYQPQENVAGTKMMCGRVFTLFSNKRELRVGKYTYEVVTSLPRWVNTIFVYFSVHKIRFLSWLFDYRNLFVLYPLLCWLLSRKINAYAPERVVISSFAAVKNIRTDAPQILYLHSPNQYIRENYSEYIEKFKFPTRQIFQLCVGYIRRADKKSHTYSEIYVNSGYTNESAQRYYGFQWTVLYPKLPEEVLTTDAVLEMHASKSFLAKSIDAASIAGEGEYYLYIGRLVKFVREVDRIIALANSMEIPLLIAGSGPDEQYLKEMAWPTVTFVGQITDLHQKVELIRHAKGLINIAKESFGMATAEALALGVPVFGYNQWGTRELVDEQSGHLISSKDAAALQHGFKTFASTSYDRKKIQERFRSRYAPHLAMRDTA